MQIKDGQEVLTNFYWNYIMRARALNILQPKWEEVKHQSLCDWTNWPNSWYFIYTSALCVLGNLLSLRIVKRVVWQNSTANHRNCDRCQVITQLSENRSQITHFQTIDILPLDFYIKTAIFKIKKKQVERGWFCKGHGRNLLFLGALPCLSARLNLCFCN